MGPEPQKYRLREFYYITHYRNVPSMLERGILSGDSAEAAGLKPETIHEPGIVEMRRERLTPDGRPLSSYANLYLWPRNPMLYRVINRGQLAVDDAAILAVTKDVLRLSGVFVSAGNAVYDESELYPANRHTEALKEVQDALGMEYWTMVDDSKRKIMAECLVPDNVPPEYIKTIYVASATAAAKLEKLLEETGFSRMPIVPDPHMFFRFFEKLGLPSNLTILEGDMFFSRMQTLTVSVNCVGVMGRGLASRAKYQFPDVYVKYQDLCRSGKIRLGKPYLYKREGSFDYELSDRPRSPTSPNGDTWFLLFPTKDHWRNRASIEGIEGGLRWLVENYKKESISSLAVPALGCGQGWLDWRDVGPLLCRYLSLFEIPVQLYLPTEKKIPDNQLTPEFLLGTRARLSDYIS
jgi:hypothetical protein